MSEEREFHKLIEAQSNEEKRNLWNKIAIQSEAESEDSISERTDVIVLSKKNFIRSPRIIIFLIVASLVVASIILLSVLLPKKNNGDDIRYCDEGDYYDVLSDLTIKQYSAETNKNILYFDWCDEAEYYIGKQYKLNTTNEIICLQEELIDLNGIYLFFFVTDVKTKVDFLEQYSLCDEITVINTVEIKFMSSVLDCFATFEYSGYKYYLKTVDLSDPEYIFDLVTELLSSNMSNVQ